MEVVLPTALASGFALVGAAAYGATSLTDRAAESGDGRVDLDRFATNDLDRARRILASRLFQGGKRLFDIVMALTLLLVSAPILAIVAALIKLDSPGPVFYRQTRVGEAGRLFDIIKFRSMRQDAEAGGAKWAAQNDSRVTRVGKVIRHFRIDEIPQAFNVLAGDMSFVGPRPERPEFVCVLEQAIPKYNLRHTVKPGITGWAQVKCEYGASVDDAREKLRFDLFYLKNYSPALDLRIVFMTVRVALFGIGSR
ncbi:MAG: exopolysaccharide biosynthesis polyprenyl glycosylphosphotransferase [Pseudomonadota bacterium]